LSYPGLRKPNEPVFLIQVGQSNPGASVDPAQLTKRPFLLGESNYYFDRHSLHFDTAGATTLLSQFRQQKEILERQGIPFFVNVCVWSLKFPPKFPPSLFSTVRLYMTTIPRR
jgi:hypothetical protein